MTTEAKQDGAHEEEPSFEVVGMESDESPSLGKLAAALARAQGKFRPASKDSTNPHLGSSYADLASIFEAARGPLSENEIAVLQPITTTPTGLIVETMLVHASGEFIRRRLEMRIEVKVSRDGKAQPWTWAFGSACSYARRYSLSAMVGITTGDDDDGATSTAEAPSHRPPPPRPSGTDALKDRLKSNGAKKATIVDAPPVDAETARRHAKRKQRYDAYLAAGGKPDAYRAWAATTLGHALSPDDWTDHDLARLEEIQRAEAQMEAQKSSKP